MKFVNAAFAIACLLFVVSNSHADIIVQWGNTDGAATNPVPNDTSIVTTSQNFSSKPTTFTSGTATNPAVGTNYYNSAAGRTPVFNSAASMDRGAGAIAIQTAQIQNNANHDRIRLVGTDTGTSLDLVNTQSMVAWESANWLPAGTNELESLSHVGFRNNQADVTTTFHFLLQKSDNSWFASTGQNWTGGSTNSGDFFITDAASEDWFAFTPLTSGVATVAGTASAIDVMDVVSVGYYVNHVYTGTGSGAPNMGIQTGYFQATTVAAVPEPSSLSILGLIGLGLLRRKRS